MPERAGKFRIIDKLGGGALGAVYKGFDTEAGRYVAVKFLHPQYARDPANRKLFVKSVIPAVRLHHPHIVQIHDIADQDGEAFVVMEYLDGMDLKYYLSAAIRFTPAQVVNLLAQVGDGLAHAHSEGIPHLGLKPSDIILQKSGQAKIQDFGLAAFAAEVLPDPNHWPIPWAAYRSPEQILGSGADARSDIFTIGAVALELLSGQSAFLRPTLDETLKAVLEADVGELIDRCPEALRAPLVRTLAKRPDERFSTLAELDAACAEASRFYAQEDGRLDGAGGMVAVPGALDEHYDVRVIRKYLREGKIDAAAALLAQLAAHSPEQPVIPSLQSEVDRARRRQRCEDLQKIGSDLIERGDYVLALASFNEILQLDPDSVEGITGIQKARRLQKEKVFREKVEPLLAQASAHGASGRYLEAVEVYRGILKLDPDLVEIRQRIEENEARVARDARARALVAEVQRALRLSDIPAACAALNTLEQTVPGESLARETLSAVWKVFTETFEAIAVVPFRNGDMRDFERWFALLRDSASVETFFAASTHREERNRFLSDVRRLVTELVQSRRLAGAKIVLDCLNPILPGQTFLRESVEEVDRQLRIDEDLRQKQLANEQRLEGGIARIRQALSDGAADEAQALWNELNRVFAADKTLAGLRSAVDAAVIRAEEDRWVELQEERLRTLLDDEEMEKARVQIQSVENSHPRRPELQRMKKLLAEKERLVAQKEEIRKIQEETVHFRASGRFDQAVEHLKKAIQRFPDEEDLYRLLQQLQGEKAQQDAEEEIGRVILEIGDLLDRKLFGRAGKAAFDLVERFPDNPSAQEALRQYGIRRAEFIENAIRSALAFSANRVFDEALRILDRAAEECPDALDIKNALEAVRIDETIQKRIADCRSFLDQKRFDLALATLEECMARHPEKAAVVRCHEEARKMRNAYVAESVRSANAFLKAGDPEKALSLLEGASHKVPNSEEVQLKIEDIRIQLKERDRLRKAEETESRSMARDVERATAEARRLIARGNPIGALRLIEQTRQRFPKSAEGLEVLVREIQEAIDRQVRKPVSEGRRLPRSPRSGKGWRRILLSCLAVGAALVAGGYFLFFRGGTLTANLGPGGSAQAVIDPATGKTVLALGGVSTFSAPLAPGKYLFSYSLPEIPGATLREPVTIQPGRTTAIALVAFTVDLRPSGNVEALVRRGLGERITFRRNVMPLRARLPAGQYDLLFRITDIPGVLFTETLTLSPGRETVFKPAMLTVDLRPGGRITALVRSDTNTPVRLQDDDIPFRISLSPGWYTVSWEFSDAAGKLFQENVQLLPGEKKQLVKVSPEEGREASGTAILLDNPAEAGWLVIDPKPWGKVVEVVRQDTGERLVSGGSVTPYCVQLPPGLYRVVYTLSDQPGKEFSEIVDLKPRGRQVIRKLSPVLETRLESIVESLMK